MGSKVQQSITNNQRHFRITIPSNPQSQPSIPCNPTPIRTILQHSDIKVLKPRRRVPMCVIVLTRSRIEKYLVCFGDFLPSGWGIRIVWQELGTVLEGEPLV